MRKFVLLFFAFVFVVMPLQGWAKNEQDVRTQKQKIEADKSNHRIKVLANAMERRRLKDESTRLERLQKEGKQLAKERQREANAKKAQEKADAKKAEQSAAKAYKPKIFVAKVPKESKK